MASFALPSALSAAHVIGAATQLFVETEERMTASLPLLL